MTTEGLEPSLFRTSRYLFTSPETSAITTLQRRISYMDPEEDLGRRTGQVAALRSEKLLISQYKEGSVLFSLNDSMKTSEQDLIGLNMV